MPPQQPPPPAGQITTLDPAWIALRAQQQDELIQFGRRVEAGKAESRRCFEAEQAERTRRFEADQAAQDHLIVAQRSQVLARHQKQDQDLWMRFVQNTQSTGTSAGDSTTLRQNGLPSGVGIQQQNKTMGSYRAIAPKQAGQATETMTPQNARPATATETIKKATPVSAANPTLMTAVSAAIEAHEKRRAEPATAKKSPKVVYGRQRTKFGAFNAQSSPVQENEVEAISLLSDDEDDVPLIQRLGHSKATSTANKTKVPVLALPIPSVTFGHPKNSLNKTNTQVVEAPSKPSTSQAPRKDNNSTASAQPMTPKCNMVKQPSHSVTACGQPSTPQRSPKKATLQPDKRPEIPFSNMRQQQMDRSSILKPPVTLSQNQSLLGLEQQKKNGAFVNNILNNERRHRLSPCLGDVLSPPEGYEDMDIDDSPLASLNIANELKKWGVRSHRTNTDNRAPPPSLGKMNTGISKDGHNACLPTPPPSRSTPSEPGTSTLPDGTKATAFKGPSVPVKSNRPKSACTDKARSLTVETRETSATISPEALRKGNSFRSPGSDVSPSRKRKQTDLSDCDENEGGGSDYAPSEPFSPLAARKARTAASLKRRKPFKSSTHTAAVVVPRSKNGLNSQVKTKLTSAPPSTPPRTPIRTTQQRTPNAPSKPSLHPLALPSSPSSPSTRSPNKRRAALLAEDKIQQLSAHDEAFRTSERILAADAREAKMNGSMQLHEKMREVSLTPVPMGIETRSNKGDGVKENVSSVAAPVHAGDGNKRGYGHGRWTRDRAKGDRHLSRNIDGLLGEENEDEGGTYEYRVVGGVIVSAGSVD